MCTYFYTWETEPFCEEIIFFLNISLKNKFLLINSLMKRSSSQKLLLI